MLWPIPSTVFARTWTCILLLIVSKGKTASFDTPPAKPPERELNSIPQANEIRSDFGFCSVSWPKWERNDFEVSYRAKLSPIYGPIEMSAAGRPAYKLDNPLSRTIVATNEAMFLWTRSLPWGKLTCVKSNVTLPMERYLNRKLCSHNIKRVSCSRSNDAGDWMWIVG